MDAQQVKVMREALESGREYATERLHEHDACYRRHPATEAQRGEMTEAIATIDKALALLDAEAERSRLELDGVARMTAEERNAWLDAYAKESEPPAPTCPRTAGPVDASPFTSDGNDPPATQSHDGYLADMIRQDGYFGLAPVAEKALAILGAEAARDGDYKPQEWDALTKKEMWDTIQSIRVITDNDGTVSPEAGVKWLIADRDSWHELASKLESEVSRLREALQDIIDLGNDDRAYMIACAALEGEA